MSPARMSERIVTAEICADQLADVTAATDAIAAWIARHPEQVDRNA